ncbi:hypothetical protein ACR71G_23345, partial [Xenorhabdus bovienii]|uniref:hypothetical protein n=1 Tax=Xenorhabdus bovienii TaxID=40576 RepID=UPI003DA49F38
MKERPIIFNADMVRAILNGRKTQTRRIVQPQYESKSQELRKCKDGFRWWLIGAESPQHRVNCPHGQIGDRLWVRETFCPVFDAQYAEGEIDWIDYRATPRYSAEYPAGWHLEPEDPAALKWRPSIHMPRWASRITLEVTDIRVERLQDIKEEDALAEGIKTGRFGNKSNWRDGFYAPGDNQPCFSAKEAFKCLWQSIYSEENWNNNPW